MNQRSGNGPNPAPGYAPDWFGRPAIFSLACLLAIAVIALAFTSGKGGPALYVTAVAALLLIAAAVWLWWPAQAGPIPLRDALAAILAMTGLVLLLGMTLPLHAAATLLLFPVIAAALYFPLRINLPFLGLFAFCWWLLGHGFQVPDLPEAIALAAEFLPVVLVVLLIRSQRRGLLAAETHLRRAAASDELTGLLTMRAFNDLAGRCHAETEALRGSYVLLMADIDGLRAINERYGRVHGDRTLAAVADALRRSIRDDDIAARYGDDEFVIALPGANADVAQQVANRLTQNVYNITLSFGSKMQRVNVHVGFAVFPTDGATLEKLIASAGQAMHRDKNFRKRIKPERSAEAEARRQAGVEPPAA